jgi:FKBP-type peptidyl-prolyl cis-trans isomerase 2
MADNEKAKKDRDPIFMSCLIIFGVAVVMVAGAFVMDHYVSSDDSRVSYGSAVTVDYTGSYYDFYDGTNAVVFDTSVKSIGTSDDYKKSNSFSKSSYSELSFTVGKGSMLKMFEDAVVGLKVGDSVRIVIPVGEGYVSPVNPQVIPVTNVEVPRTETYSKSDFTSLYSDVTLTPGVLSSVFTSVYGWDAQAIIDTAYQTVIVNYNPSIQTYEYQGNEDSEFGKVKYVVKSVGEVITCDLLVEGYTLVNSATGEIQMIELDYGGSDVWYVTNVTSDEVTYKTTAERDNIALYFDITVRSIA